MQGENKMIVNQETMLEIVQLWLNATFYKLSNKHVAPTIKQITYDRTTK